MTLGIAIPTYSEHLGHLSNLLDQISKSTILPKQVSISISSFDRELNFKEPPFKEYPFELIISQTSEFKNVSENRNIAGSKLNTDIISFIDGDDVPHVKRVEYLLKSFEMGVDAVVHNYQYTGLVITHYSCEIGEFNILKDCIDTYAGGAHISPISSTSPGVVFANGHISVLKKVFDNHKYDESQWLFRCCEDVEFSGRLILNGYKISYIQNKISLYRK